MRRLANALFNHLSPTEGLGGGTVCDLLFTLSELYMTLRDLNHIRRSQSSKFNYVKTLT